MSTHKYLNLILLVLITLNLSCNSTSNKTGLSIKTSAKNNTAILGSTVQLSLNNPEGVVISSVKYTINGESVNTTVELKDVKLGTQDVVATVLHDNDTTLVKGQFKVLNNVRPKVYTYEIINTYPHDITSYTQGLEFHNGELYESTGQYRESKLRKVDYKTGEVLKNVDLNPGYFGEGLSILDGKIYQLTWKADTGLIYDLNTFEQIGMFRYDSSIEGWGLCNDGNSLYKSDGTDKIWTLNTTTLTEDGKIEAYMDTNSIGQLNELEWINGKIYANIYQQDGVAIIDPSSGAVEGVIDFKPLKKLVTQHPKLDVLNGIAYNPETETIFVTGKNWDKLFEVKIIER
ncbi:MAG: glutaminyl-peptide cyclotransferase [Bacteroidota bacterium]